MSTLIGMSPVRLLLEILQLNHLPNIIAQDIAIYMSIDDWKETYLTSFQKLPLTYFTNI